MSPEQASAVYVRAYQEVWGRPPYRAPTAWLGRNVCRLEQGLRLRGLGLGTYLCGVMRAYRRCYPTRVWSSVILSGAGAEVLWRAYRRWCEPPVVAPLAAGGQARTFFADAVAAGMCYVLHRTSGTPISWEAACVEERVSVQAPSDDGVAHRRAIAAVHDFFTAGGLAAGGAPRTWDELVALIPARSAQARTSVVGEHTWG